MKKQKVLLCLLAGIFILNGCGRNNNDNIYNHNNVKISRILRVVVKLIFSEKRSKEKLLVDQML